MFSIASSPKEANNFLIGANDEHGLNPPTAGKRTPIISYLGRSFYENEFNSKLQSKKAVTEYLVKDEDTHTRHW